MHARQRLFIAFVMTASVFMACGEPSLPAQPPPPRGIRALLEGTWKIEPGHTWEFSFPNDTLQIVAKYDPWPGLDAPRFGDRVTLNIRKERRDGDFLNFEVVGDFGPYDGCYTLYLARAEIGEIAVVRKRFYIGDEAYGRHCTDELAESFVLSKPELASRPTWN